MDIIMDKSELGCRREIWWGSARREEMTECVVPDTYPDIGSIIDVCAQVFIRGKTASGDRAAVECAVVCSVLYTGEGEGSGVFRLETEIPLSLTADVAGANEETDIMAVPELENIEVRLLNPRKILAKAELRADMRCFMPGTLTVTSTATGDDRLQLLEQSCPAFPVTDVREKTFVITDEIALPPAPEGYGRILAHSVSLGVQDVKFVGSKLIFKGEAAMRILAEPEGNTAPVFFCSSFSFSQIMELSCEAENARVELCLTDSCLSLGENEQGKPVINAELHILAQAAAGVSREVSYIADAYSNAGECEIAAEEMPVPQEWVTTQLRDTFRCTLDTPTAVRQVICANIRCAVPGYSENGVSARVTVSCMYIDENGALASTVKCDTLRLDGEMPGDIRGIRLNWGEVYAAPAVGGVDVRVPVEVSVMSCADVNICSVCGITLTEKESAEKRPSVYVIPNMGADLWMLAKKYHSTVELIEANNSEAGDVILIPVQ